MAQSPLHELFAINKRARGLLLRWSSERTQPRQKELTGGRDSARAFSQPWVGLPNRTLETLVDSADRQRRSDVDGRLKRFNGDGRDWVRVFPCWRHYEESATPSADITAGYFFSAQWLDSLLFLDKVMHRFVCTFLKKEEEQILVWLWYFMCSIYNLAVPTITVYTEEKIELSQKECWYSPAKMLICSFML